MDLSLGVAVSLSSFVLSPAIHLAKRKDIKPAFTQIVSSDSFPPGLYSIAGAIALGFLNVSIQKYSVLDHDDALWRAPGSLQVPTPTLMPTSTPSSPRPTTNPTKQVFSLAATLCAFLIGFAYVMHLASSTNNICSPPSEPLSNYNGSRRPAQPNGDRGPSPWPLPTRRPSGSQPPNRNSTSAESKPRKGLPQRRQSMGRPNRDDPPPPPPPSFTGFIEDFPWPENFEEYIAMNFILGALTLWILKLLVRFYRYRRAPEKRQILASLPPTRAPSPTPRKTGDLSKTTHYGLPQQRQTPFPATLERSKDPVSFYLGFTLASSGSVAIWGLKARHRAATTKHANLPIICTPPADTRSFTDNCAAPDKHSYPTNKHRVRSPHSPTTIQWQPSITCRSPNDCVRLSNVNQVKYFYKDEIIGFENGPPPRQGTR